MPNLLPNPMPNLSASDVVGQGAQSAAAVGTNVARLAPMGKLAKATHNETIAKCNVDLARVAHEVRSARTLDDVTAYSTTAEQAEMYLRTRRAAIEMGDNLASLQEDVRQIRILCELRRGELLAELPPDDRKAVCKQHGIALNAVGTVIQASKTTPQVRDALRDLGRRRVAADSGARTDRVVRLTDYSAAGRLSVERQGVLAATIRAHLDAKGEVCVDEVLDRAKTEALRQVPPPKGHTDLVLRSHVRSKTRRLRQLLDDAKSEDADLAELMRQAMQRLSVAGPVRVRTIAALTAPTPDADAVRTGVEDWLDALERAESDVSHILTKLHSLQLDLNKAVDIVTKDDADYVLSCFATEASDLDPDDRTTARVIAGDMLGVSV